TARTRRVLASMATTDGSLMTMPRSRTWTRVLAVPRSIPMSREKMPRIRSSMAGRRSLVVGLRVAGGLGGGHGRANGPGSGESRGVAAGWGGKPRQYNPATQADHPGVELRDARGTSGCRLDALRQPGRCLPGSFCHERIALALEQPPRVIARGDRPRAVPARLEHLGEPRKGLGVEVQAVRPADDL